MTLRCLACLSLIASLCLSGCSGGNGCLTSNQGQIVGTISAQQLWSKLGSTTKPTIIDVRGRDAYALSHLPGSSNDCGCPTATVRSKAEPGLVVVGLTLAQAVLAGPRVLEPGQQALALEGGMQDWPYGLDISREQLNLLLQANRDLQVIDVRTAAEFEAGHLPGSLNHPLADIAVWADTLDRSQEFVLVCGSGARSATARDELIRRGFGKVHNLVGGLGTASPR